MGHKSGGRRRRRERKPPPPQPPKPPKPPPMAVAAKEKVKRKRSEVRAERQQFIPLGVYLEEQFRAKGLKWPPDAEAAASTCTTDDAVPDGGPFITLTATHDGRPFLNGF